MGSEGRKTSVTYPRSAINLIWQNRFTVLGGVLSLAAPGREFVPEDAEVLRNAALWAQFAGFFLLSVTHFGTGTIGAYRRTIDAFRRTGKAPLAYQGKYEGMYCAERGFRLAIKDIEAEKVYPLPK